MSHLHPEAKAQRHKRKECRKGRHVYGEEQHVGAGILRRVCTACASVTIDLTYADELEAPIQANKPNILSMARQSKAP